MSIIHLYLHFLFPPLHLYPEKRAKLFEVSPCETGCPLRESTVPDSLLKILKSLKPFSPRSLKIIKKGGEKRKKKNIYNTKKLKKETKENS